MALVIKKYAEGDVIENPTVVEEEVLEPFQPIENPSVLAAMAPKLEYIIHRNSMEYDPATVRDYITNDYNLRTWSHNRGMNETELSKFELAVNDILVSGIDAGTLDFLNENSIYVPEQYAGDGNYNTKDTLRGKKIITDDDKAARIEAVNYLKHAFSHGYILPKLVKAAFNADRIVMLALAEKVGNGSMAALLSVWQGLSPLERLRALRDTLNHLDYLKIFENYDFSNTDVKNAKELHDRILALLSSFTGGELTNENYLAAGRAGISILKDLIYGRNKSVDSKLLENSGPLNTLEAELKNYEELWRALGYTEEQIQQMLAAKKAELLELLLLLYDLIVNGKAYNELTLELRNLDNDPIYVSGSIYPRYEPDSENSMKGLLEDLNNSNTSIYKLALRISGSNGLLVRNKLISDILSRGGTSINDKTTIRDLMYIMRSYYNKYDGYVCFGYFPNLGKIVYGDLASLTITTSSSEVLGNCINPNDIEEAYEQYIKDKHPNLNYNLYKKSKTASTDRSIDINEGLQYKKGGILKALTGAAIGSINDIKRGAQNLKQTHYDTRKQAAIENGMSEKMFDAQNKDFSWDDLSGEDWVRMGSIASDVGALASSFAPGYGTVASGGLSLLGTVLDFGADISDDAVSSGEMWTNLGVNLGAAAVGLLPGGKTASVGAKLAKSAKLLTRVLTAAGFGYSAMKLNEMVKKGNKYGWDTISKKDWIDLARAITTISNASAGTVRGTKMALARNTVKNKGMMSSVETDKFVIEGNFKTKSGENIKKLELDGAQDKSLIDQLKAAPDNKTRLEILLNNNKISSDSSNRIKLQDDRNFYKQIRGKLGSEKYALEETDSNWYVRRNGVEERVMNWDEFVENYPALKESLLDKNGSEVLVQLNSKELKRYLRVLAVENPTSYRKALNDIKFMRSIANKAPGLKFRNTLDNLSENEAKLLIQAAQPSKSIWRWINPATWLSRLNESWLARPFTNETPYEGRWLATKSAWNLLFSKEHTDYRKEWSNTPLLPKKTSTQTPTTTLTGPTVGGAKTTSGFSKGLKEKVNLKLGENGELIKPNSNFGKKLESLRQALDPDNSKNISNNELMSRLLGRYIKNYRAKHTTTTGGNSASKSDSDIIEELFNKTNPNFWKELHKVLGQELSEIPARALPPSGTLLTIPGFNKEGGILFARRTIRKYAEGDRVLRTNNLVAGTSPYEIYDYNTVFNEDALKALLLELATDSSNFEKYNNYNNEFFKLRKELYGEKGFGSGSHFTEYTPKSYDRSIFNKSAAGKLMNKSLTGDRRMDVDPDYNDNWWGTKQDNRHFGSTSNKDYIQEKINNILAGWANGTDQEKSWATALAGLQVNPNDIGALLYTTEAMRNQAGQDPSKNGQMGSAEEEFRRFAAEGNDVERTPLDVYEDRVDLANLGELWRLHDANRVNQGLRYSYGKDKVALESPAYKQGTIASTYAIENANNDASNRILDQLLKGPLYSDDALNTAALLNAYELILKTEATNNATRDKYYQENVNDNQEIANYNRAAGVATANKNRESIVKWWNDYLDHIRDLDVEDFNNRDRWLASLILQEIQKRTLKNNLNYIKYALNQDYNNTLYKIDLNDKLTLAITERQEKIRREANKAGIYDETEILDIIDRDLGTQLLIHIALIWGLKHDIESKVGMNDAMLGVLNRTTPFSYSNVYNQRQKPWLATPSIVGVDLGNRGNNTGRVTYKKGGKVEYTEDKARKKLFDIMGQEYLDMLKRNSKYVLHKK